MKRAFFCSITLLLLLLAIGTHATNYYWVGGTGNWSEVSSHWATASGGNTFHSQVPQSVDNVYFDANSFTATGQSVTIDQTIVNVKDIIWSGVNYSPAWNGDPQNILRVFGSLQLAPGMSLGFKGKISFEATTTGNTIISAGNIFNNPMEFIGTGSWVLGDAFNSYENVVITNGNWATNNNSVYASVILVRTTGVVALGTSTITINNTSGWNATTTSVAAASSNFIMLNGGYFGGGSNDYGNVRFQGTIDGSASGKSFRDVSFNVNGDITNTTARNVTIRGNGNINGLTATNLFVAGTASLTSSNIGTVTLGGNGFFGGNVNCTNITFAPSYTYTFSGSTVLTVTDTMNISGTCSMPINLTGPTNSGQGTINHPSDSVTLEYLYIKSMKTLGGIFTANNSIDQGNNTGWIINTSTARNLYWVGNGGNWTDGGHWAATSGGTPTGCTPTVIDNVFFDSNSFTTSGQIVWFDLQNTYCNDMTWTGVTNIPTVRGTNNLYLNGSMALAPGMNFYFAGNTTFTATTGYKTIFSGGNAFNQQINFTGTAHWTMMDAFTSHDAINIRHGSLHTAGYPLQAKMVLILTQDSILLDTSTVTITGNSGWVVGHTYIDGAQSTFYMLAGGGLSGGGNVYRDVFFPASVSGTVNDGKYRDIYFTGDGSIYDSVTARNIFIAGAGSVSLLWAQWLEIHGDAAVSTVNIHSAKLYKNVKFDGQPQFDNLTLGSGFTYTFNNDAILTVTDTLYAVGTCSRPNIFIGAYLSGTISHPAGNVTIDYATLTNMTATGGATFVANHCLDFGNNTGWTINALQTQDRYWVGGTGAWSDGSHWANTSGGTPTGCAPTLYDNAYFDSNSFSAPNQSVLLDMDASCKNMVWTGVTNNPTLMGSNTNSLAIHGNMVLSPAMAATMKSPVSFVGNTTAETLITGGIALQFPMTFDANTNWTMGDAINTSGAIAINKGNWNTNNYNINANSLYINSSGSILLGTSTITLNVGAGYHVSSATVAGASSTFHINYGGSFIDFNNTYQDIFFTGLQSSTVQVLSCRDISFDGSGGVLGTKCRDVYVGVNGDFSLRDTIRNITVLGSATLNDLTAKKVTVAGSTNVDASSIDTAILNGDATFGPSNIFGNVELGPGSTYLINTMDTLTVLHDLGISGTGGFPVRIQSSAAGYPAYISKPAGTVCVDFIRLSDIYAIGGAHFFAGENSQDLGNNLGWQFLSPINISPTLSVSATVNGGSCPITSIDFLVTDSALIVPIYQWYINGVLQHAQGNLIHTDNLMVGDTITAILIDTLPCGIRKASYQYVVKPVNVPVSISASQQVICPNDSVRICGPQGWHSYTWNTGDTTSCTYAKASGAYTLTAIDSNGCAGTSNIINILPSSPPLLTSSIPIICPNTTAYICGPQGWQHFIWSNGDTTHCIATTTSGSFILTATDTNGCMRTSDTFNIMASPLPAIVIVNDTLFATAGSQFTWLLNGVPIAGANGPFYVPVDTGSYQVMLMDTNDCYSTSLTTVYSYTGMDEIGVMQGINIYPNPFNDLIIIELTTGIEPETIVEVFDVSGRKMCTHNASALTHLEIATGQWPTGVYMANIRSNNNSFNAKIVKL